jgi:hypothetical protein
MTSLHRRFMKQFKVVGRTNRQPLPPCRLVKERRRINDGQGSYWFDKNPEG